MSTKKTDLKTQLEQLEKIVAWFEGEDINIEEAIDKFKEGSVLAEDIKERLDELDNQITVLKERFDEQVPVSGQRCSELRR